MPDHEFQRRLREETERSLREDPERWRFSAHTESFTTREDDYPPSHSPATGRRITDPAAFAARSASSKAAWVERRRREAERRTGNETG